METYPEGSSSEGGKGPRTIHDKITDPPDGYAWVKRNGYHARCNGCGKTFDTHAMDLWQFNVEYVEPKSARSVAWSAISPRVGRQVNTENIVVCEDCLPTFERDHAYGCTIICNGKLGYKAEYIAFDNISKGVH